MANIIKLEKKVVEVTKKKEILKEHFTDKRDTLYDVYEDDKEGKEKKMNLKNQVSKWEKSLFTSELGWGVGYWGENVSSMPSLKKCIRMFQVDCKNSTEGVLLQS